MKMSQGSLMKCSEEGIRGSGFDPPNDGHDSMARSVIKVNYGEGSFGSNVKKKKTEINQKQREVIPGRGCCPGFVSDQSISRKDKAEGIILDDEHVGTARFVSCLRSLSLVTCGY